tara:strand:+ start:244 stop:456 length:213 start_codon:yes stop_codon:yes gene_type:complete
LLPHLLLGAGILFFAIDINFFINSFHAKFYLDYDYRFYFKYLISKTRRRRGKRCHPITPYSTPTIIAEII